jgi:signal peptidase II
MEDALKSSLWGPWSRVGLQAALATLVIDQAQKWWMIKGVGLPECVRERCITITVTPFLDLKYVRNTGISYSLLDQKTMTSQYVLAVFALVASVALWIWLARSGTGRLMAVSLGLIIGGAVANGIDRVVLGGVADFFSLHVGSFYWYIFNLADVAIVAGVAGLLYDSYLTSRKDAAKAG